MCVHLLVSEEALKLPPLPSPTTPCPPSPTPYAILPTGKALLDTLSKKKYGAQLRQQGGWAFKQEMLQVCAWERRVGGAGWQRGLDKK